MACNVKDFGAVGNGIADDKNAIRNALAACPCVYFPSGTYVVELSAGSFSLTDSQQVYGDGYSTIIKRKSTDASTVATFLLASGRNIVKEMILEGRSSSTYSAIGIQIGNAGFSGIHKIQDVLCRYFDKGIKLSGALWTNLYDCRFESNNYGETYEAAAGVYSTTVAHYSCSFNANKRNGIVGLSVPGRNLCLSYYSCDIEGNGTENVSLYPQVSLSTAGQVVFNCCYFEHNGASKPDTININAMSQFTISNCYFNGANRHIAATSIIDHGVISANRFLNTSGTNSVDMAALNVKVHALSNESDKPIVLNGSTSTLITSKIAQI